MFLREAPGPNGVVSVEAVVERARSKKSRDDVRVGRSLYSWTPDGFARSILRSELSRGGRHRTPMQAGTARNLGTINTLVSLLESPTQDAVPEWARRSVLPVSREHRTLILNAGRGRLPRSVEGRLRADA